MRAFLLALFCVPVFSQSWFVPSYLDQNNNADQDCALPDNVVESGGFLTITANYVSGGVSCGSANHALSSQNYTAGWMIGNIPANSFSYGLVVFRAAFSGKTGTWPAIWLAAQSCATAYKTTLSPTSPSAACTYQSSTYLEFDIAEVKGGVLDQFAILTSSHGGTLPAIDVTQYHVYAVNFTATGATFYVDGVLTFTFSGSIPATLMTPMFAFTIGGAGGTPTPSDYPQTLSADYFRVCPSGTALPTSGTPTGGCTSAAATVFGDEFNASLFQSSVYVGQSFNGNATGLDCADAFGVLNNTQVSWINDAGYWSNGQIGPGTTINLCPVGGSVSTTLVMQGSGTSGSPITVNSCGVGSTINLNGQTNINQSACGAGSSGPTASSGNAAHN